MTNKTTRTTPTMHLVLALAAMDDLPLLLTPSMVAARRYAMRRDLGSDLRAAADTMGVDTSLWFAICIVSFRWGRPFRVTRVRVISESEADTANWPESRNPKPAPTKPRRNKR